MVEIKNTTTEITLLPSGNLTIFNSLLLKMAIEIVDLPINSMVMFRSYVRVAASRRSLKDHQGH
jgi:hypothetical protein